MTYTCNICGTNSDEVAFYKGVTSRCKECHKQKIRKNRAENADYYRAYDAKRFQDDPRVLARHRKYQQSDAGKASLKKSKEKWQKANPEKRAAHLLLQTAVNSGDKSKPKSCQVCDREHYRIHGHHADYTRPLDVVWCCPQCHHDIHAAMES